MRAFQGGRLAAVWHGFSPGVRYMAGAAFFFSLMALQVRIAGQSLPSVQIVLARAVVTLMLAGLAIQRLGLSWRGHARGLLVLRGLLGCGALLCFYHALTRLPLAEATVIQFMNPVFATLMAAWWLRERAGAREVFALVISLLGVVAITRPEFLTQRMDVDRDVIAVMIALLGSLLSSAAYVTVRKLGRTENAHVIVFYFPLVTVPLVLPFALWAWVAPTPAQWLLLLGIGVTTQIAQVWMTRALQVESTGKATTAGYLQILFAGLWGALLLGESPDLFFALGAVLIGTGVIVVGRRTRRTA